MGLNFPATTAWKNEPPFIGSLINQGVVGQFGVKLTSSGNGEIYFGGYDSALISGSSYWTPVTDEVSELQ